MINDFDKRIISLLIVECDHLIEVCDKNNDYEIRSSFILSDAIQYEFEKLFEDISRLSKEIQEDPTLHFNELRGIRNRIAHNYETVSISILIDTVKKDIPSLKGILKNYLEID